MTNYQYLIVGGGMTAAAAADGIREVDSIGAIGLISAEPDAPYNRPPLSKALWKGEPLEIIWRKTENKLMKIHLGRVVKGIVPVQKRVLDDKGGVFTYQKLLLATGGRPRRLPFGDDQIIYFRTLSDYRRLRALAETGRRFDVIGGGFIGSEIAAALALNGKEVVMIFPGKDIGDRIFPRALAQFVSNFYKHKGVELLAGEKIIGLEARGVQRVLKTSTNREIVVDGVVAGVGIEPNVELAQSVGLKVENGKRSRRVPAHQQLALSSCSTRMRFPNAGLENAATSPWMSGWLAGRNMASSLSPMITCRSFTPTCSIWIRSRRRGGFTLGNVCRLEATQPGRRHLLLTERPLLLTERPRAWGVAVECVGAGGGRPSIDRRAWSIHSQGS